MEIIQLRLEEMNYLYVNNITVTYTNIFLLIIYNYLI